MMKIQLVKSSLIRVAPWSSENTESVPLRVSVLGSMESLANQPIDGPRNHHSLKKDAPLEIIDLRVKSSHRMKRVLLHQRLLCLFKLG
jgi:hypothetical protein